MSIETERLVLKEISSADMEIIHQLHSVPEVDEFNTLGIPKNIEETISVMKPFTDDLNQRSRSKYCWMILLKNSGQVVGMCGMTLSNDRFRMAEIFYKLFPRYWGNGYATESAKRIIQFGFNELKLHRIEAGVEVKNTASIRVLEKAGMTNEGLRRKILPIRGTWRDNFHFAILEDD